MSQKIILHIDDDDDDCQLMKEAIESNKAYLLKQYTDGRAGLKFLEQTKVLGDVPCLIIVDMNMPVIDGRQIVKKIKEDEVLSKVAVIVFTTSDGYLDQEFCKKYEVPILVKPFVIKQFSLLVQKMLEQAC